MSTPSIEDVLREHQWCRYVEYGPCTCGDLTAFTADTHRAHVADAIRAHLAEHTDETAGAVERVRGLAAEWEHDCSEGPGAAFAGDLRAALAGGASGDPGD